MLHKPGGNGKNEVSRTKETGTGVGYAKGRLSHPSTSVVLNGIHACLLDQRVLSSARFTATGKERNEWKWKRGEMARKGTRQASRLCLRISRENQSFVVRKEMGNCGNLCSRRIVALVPTYLARARESERRSSAHYG